MPALVGLSEASLMEELKGVPGTRGIPLRWMTMSKVLFPHLVSIGKGLLTSPWTGRQG